MRIHDTIISNHSNIRVEFDSKKLFGDNTEYLGATLDASFTAREIKMGKYNEKVEKHLDVTKMEQRQNQLDPSLSEDIFVTDYEKISSDVDDSMRAGINKVRTKNIGYTQSSALTKAATAVQYWRTH